MKAPRKIKTIKKLAELAADRTVYVRYSRSIARDIKRGYSLDHSQMSREPGLSAVDIRPEDFAEEGWLARLLVSYGHLRYDGARAYVLTGEVAGKDSDGCTCLDASTIEVLGVLDRTLVECLADYSLDYSRWRERWGRSVKAPPAPVISEYLGPHRHL